MTGNVQQWVMDEFNVYNGYPAIDPVGFWDPQWYFNKNNGSGVMARVIRGANFYTKEQRHFQGTWREYGDRSSSSNLRGFRLARPQAPDLKSALPILKGLLESGPTLKE